MRILRSLLAELHIHLQKLSDQSLQQLSEAQDQVALMELCQGRAS